MYMLNIQTEDTFHIYVQHIHCIYICDNGAAGPLFQVYWRGDQPLNWAMWMSKGLGTAQGIEHREEPFLAIAVLHSLNK